MEYIKEKIIKRRQSKHTRKTKKGLLDKNSPFNYVESFNTLRTNIKFSSSANNIKTIMLTSALPDEGKSTVAINLAETLAKDNHKILLIEADLRKPSIQKYLHVKSGFISGLSDVLANQVPIESAIHHSQERKFDVLLAGTRVTNPSELLASKNFSVLLEELEEHYDYILIDTPPASLVTDAAIISRLVGGTILVVRQNHSTIDDILQAKENLQRVDANFIGVILNYYDAQIDPSKASSAVSYEYYE